jgi:hypothetical protein
VESANQRSFSLNTQFVAASGQRALDNATFVSTQAQLGFLGLTNALGLGGQLNNSILGGREVRDQPNVSPTIAFVPSPAGAVNPGAASATGTPAVTPSTTVGH